MNLIMFFEVILEGIKKFAGEIIGVLLCIVALRMFPRLRSLFGQYNKLKDNNLSESESQEEKQERAEQEIQPEAQRGEKRPAKGLKKFTGAIIVVLLLFIVAWQMLPKSAEQEKQLEAQRREEERVRAEERQKKELAQQIEAQKAEEAKRREEEERLIALRAEVERQKKELAQQIEAQKARGQTQKKAPCNER